MPWTDGLDLQECLAGCFVSSGICMNVRNLAEYCTVSRWSVLFILSVAVMLWLISIHSSLHSQDVLMVSPNFHDAHILACASNEKGRG